MLTGAVVEYARRHLVTLGSGDASAVSHCNSRRKEITVLGMTLKGLVVMHLKTFVVMHLKISHRHRGAAV